MSLEAIKDSLILDEKLSNKSMYLKEAFSRLKKKRRFKFEEYEQTFDPFEVILTCYDIARENDKKRGNINGSK